MNKSKELLENLKRRFGELTDEFNIASIRFNETVSNLIALCNSNGMRSSGDDNDFEDLRKRFKEIELKTTILRVASSNIDDLLTDINTKQKSNVFFTHYSPCIWKHKLLQLGVPSVDLSKECNSIMKKIEQTKLELETNLSKENMNDDDITVLTERMNHIVFLKRKILVLDSMANKTPRVFPYYKDLENLIEDINEYLKDLDLGHLRLKVSCDDVASVSDITTVTLPTSETSTYTCSGAAMALPGHDVSKLPLSKLVEKIAEAKKKDKQINEDAVFAAELLKIFESEDELVKEVENFKKTKADAIRAQIKADKELARRLQNES